MGRTALVLAALVIAVTGACGPIAGGLVDAGDDDLECFEADQPIEPTFDTPETALEHALEGDTAGVPVPERADDDEPVERSDGLIEFGFRESEDRYVTWVVAQNEDGRFGVVSVSGCSPATG